MEALITDLLLLSRLETSERRTGDAVCYPAPLLRQIQQDAIALSGDQQHRITLSIDDSRAIQGTRNSCAALSPTWFSMP